jgi:hypothetical protein
VTTVFTPEGETAKLKSTISCGVSLRVTPVAYTAAQLVLGSPGFSCVDKYTNLHSQLKT